MFSSAILLAGLAVTDATRGNCYMGGDPHVRTFDMTRGWTFHPVFAPGTWWLVHTESGEFQAQATYSQCGRRTGGGWQGWRAQHNTSAHCLESLAVAGSLLGGKGLAIQPPCTWNWGEMKCDECSADRMPRVMFNGQKLGLKMHVWTDIADKLRARCSVNRCEVKVDGERVAMVVAFHGGAGFEPTRTKTCTAGTLGSLHMWMNKGDFGKQCGHCGNFDGDAGNDRIFDHTGQLVNKQSSALCESDVKDCHQMFQTSAIPTQYNSKGEIIPADETLCNCNDQDNKCTADDTRRDVVQLCAASYQQVCGTQASPSDDLHQGFFEECKNDACLGGTAFTEIDVEDEEELDCTETQSMNDDAVCRHCKK